MAKISVGSHHGEPMWRPVRSKYQVAIPDELVAWIFDTPSLTRRMQQLCNGTFRVRVLSEQWQRPMFNERVLLGMRDSDYGRVRQVQLLCNSRPWIFARTVIPGTTLSGTQRRLAHLGNKPLGALLFADKSVQRGRMEVTCIKPGQPIYEIATRDLKNVSTPIWGRRSIFYRDTKPLLVSEIFLPTIAAATCSCKPRR
jgi:chorismate lyase